MIMFSAQVRRDNDPLEGSEHILALNMHGVHFLDLITHETILHYPFTEVISTRQVRPSSHWSRALNTLILFADGDR